PSRSRSLIGDSPLPSGTSCRPTPNTITSNTTQPRISGVSGWGRAVSLTRGGVGEGGRRAGDGGCDAAGGRDGDGDVIDPTPWPHPARSTGLATGRPPRATDRGSPRRSTRWR